MRTVLRTLIGLLLFIGLLAILAYFTGNEHLIKGVRYTYLIGRSGPEIDDRDQFASARIAASRPVPWTKGSRYGELALDQAQERRLVELHTAGFLVVQDDSLIFEQQWGGWRTDSVRNSFSVAKSYISALTGIALRDGMIQSLEQRVGEFLPEFDNGCHARITLWHLLTMSTGLDWSESGRDPFSDAARGYYGSHVRKVSLEQPCRTEPGLEFDYISGSTQIMAEVLEAAYGTGLDQLMQEKLWEPLGAEHDAWWGKDHAEGDFKAFCCLYATDRDFARLGKLYLDSGRWHGQTIIPLDFWQASITPAPLSDGGRPNERYGYFWWLAELEGRPIHYARGFHGQYVAVVPDERLVMVRTGMKREEVNDEGHPRDVFEWIGIARELAGNRPGGPHIAADRP